MAAMSGAWLRKKGIGPNRLVLDCVGTALAGHILRSWSNLRDRGAGELRRVGGLAPRTLKVVQSYIHDQLERDLTLHELAELAGLSSYLCVPKTLSELMT